MIYIEVVECRKNFGVGIVELYQWVGVMVDKKYVVGFWVQNCFEWQIIELVLFLQFLWFVLFYEIFGFEVIEYIINYSELIVVVCLFFYIFIFLKFVFCVFSFKFIIFLDFFDVGEMIGYFKLLFLNVVVVQVGFEIFFMEGVEVLGVCFGCLMCFFQFEDVLIINYIFGIIGDFKGVFIIYVNGVVGILVVCFNQSIMVGDVYLFYFFFVYIYGCMVDQIVFVEGVSIGYFYGDIIQFVEDIKFLCLIGFMLVFCFFNCINFVIQVVMVEQEGFKGVFLCCVIEVKKVSMKFFFGKVINKYFFYDKIWIFKVFKGVGFFCVCIMVSGFVQFDFDVYEFFCVVFGNNFVQGFGMIEIYVVGIVQMFGDFIIGNIGFLCFLVEFCIEFVFDYEYIVEDKFNFCGELFMCGFIIFKEYYCNFEEMVKMIEVDGWFYIGDIVEVDSMGCFKIIDCKKNVFKFVQGEYIFFECIENVYFGSCNFFVMVFVYGEFKELSLVVVFGIDFVYFVFYVSKIFKQNIFVEDKVVFKVVVNDLRVKGVLLKLLDNIGKSYKFNSYEKVKNIYLDIEFFLIENEFLIFM